MLAVGSAGWVVTEIGWQYRPRMRAHVTYELAEDVKLARLEIPVDLVMRRIKGTSLAFVRFAFQTFRSSTYVFKKCFRFRLF